MKKTVLSIVNFLLAIVAIVLSLAVFIQVIMTAGLLWLGSAKGQIWLQAQLTESLAASGYKVSMSGLSYHSMQGIAATQVRIADKDGEILRADRLMANIDLVPLLHKQASVTLKGTNVVLSRVPESEPSPEPETALQSFTLPDIYITSLDADVSVNRLTLAEGVAGQAMVIAPSLNVALDLSEKIQAEATLDLDQPETQIAFLPQKIELKGEFSPQDLTTQLDYLKASAPDFNLEAQGRADLHETGAVELSLSAKSDDLTALAGQAGAVTLDAQLTGTMDKPLLNASGNLSLEQLKAQGLGDVALVISTAIENNQPLGHANIKTTYKELPVTLDADYRYEDPVLSLYKLTATAPDLDLTGALNVDTKTLIADGQIDLKAQKLETYSELVGATLSGAGSVQLSLSNKEDKQGADLKLSLTKGQYEDVSVQNVDAAASLNDIATLWPQSLDLKASGLVLSADARLDALTVKLTEASAQSYHVTLDTKGQAMQAFQLKGSTDLALVEGKPEANNIKLDLTSSGASVSVTGSASEAALDLNAALKNLTGAIIPAELPDFAKSMSASGTIDLTGTTAQPVIQSALDFSTLKIKDGLPSIKIAATGSYAESLAKLDVTGTGQGIRTLKAHAEVPVTLALYPFSFAMSDAAPLVGSADFDLSGTTLLAALLPPEHKFTGDLKGQVTLAGTVPAPKATGSVSINGASYIYEPYGVKLQNLALDAALTDTQIKLQKLSATDGEKGNLSGSGVMDLQNPAQTSLSLKLANYHVVQSQTANGMVDADVSLKGQGEGYLLGGTITLGPLNITIPEQFKSNIPQLNIVTDEKPAGPNATLQSVALNLNVVAENQVFVRGWGLDAEFGGKIAATGTLDDPQLNGDFSSIRGRYEEFGKRFALAKSVLRFQGSVPPSPYLDIEATTTAGDVVASVLLTGPVSKPKINFSSVPALPEDEVLSRILFGQNMERITPFQAVQLAQTLQRFSGNGGGGIDPLGQIRSLTGLDDISVETDADGQTSVGVGKYLTDKVYLELQKGKAETSGAASLQIEVTPSVTIESEIGQDAQAGGGVFWKRDY